MKGFVLTAWLVAPALAISAPASAQLGQVNDPAPGYSSLMNADYAAAEREIRAADVSKYDPARSINLGIALAKTGRKDAAARQFRYVLSAEDVEVIVADGETVMAHDVARRGLASLENGVLSR